MPLPERSVTRSVVVPAPPEEVWDALTDPDRLEEWFADSVDGDLAEPEGEVLFGWEDGERREAVVEEVEAPDRLAFWWWREGEAEGSRVTFELVPAVGGTRVVVVESSSTGVPAGWGPRLVAACAAVALAA